MTSSAETRSRPDYPGALTAQRIGQIIGNNCRLAASTAILEGNAPFACAITDLDGNPIVTTRNTTSTSRDPTAHAEINAIRSLEGQRLDEYVIFSNAVSCAMCYSALLKNGGRRFFYGAPCARDSAPWLSLPEMRDMLSNAPNSENGWLVAGVQWAACLRQIERGRIASKDWLYRSALADNMAGASSPEHAIVSAPRIMEAAEDFWHPGIQAWPAEGACSDDTLATVGIVYDDTEIANGLMRGATSLVM